MKLAMLPITTDTLEVESLDCTKLAVNQTCDDCMTAFWDEGMSEELAPTHGFEITNHDCIRSEEPDADCNCSCQ